MRVAIVDGCRTPIGKYGGGLQKLTAADMGVAVVQALFARTGIDPTLVGEVIVGNARQAGGGPNVARQISVRSGIPATAPAWTVNMACGSGLRAILDAARDIQAGDVTVAVAGGTESMSRLPYLVERARWGNRLGNMELTDSMYRDGFLCPLAKEIMGETVEWLAGEYGIPRADQDRFALTSQERVRDAVSRGAFAAEIVPIAAGGGSSITRDEHPREDSSLESLARLKPVFSPEGTITPGNSSGITDGAAMVLLMSEGEVRKRGLMPLGWIEAAAAAGVDPRAMGIGPVPAIRKLLSSQDMCLEQFQLFELNEAFAAQVLCVLRDIPIPLDRLNVNGGAIALGHPIGATGARIVVTLLHEMRRRASDRGLASLCISGGMGLAVAVSRM